MRESLHVTDPACKAQEITQAYQQEVTAMLDLSFTEKPPGRMNPYTLIGRLEIRLLELKLAISAREASKAKRVLHEINVLTARANIESRDLETGDLL